MAKITCTKCGIPKTRKEFYSNKRTRSGLRSECKECSKGMTRDYRNGKKQKTVLDVLKEIRDLLKEMKNAKVVNFIHRSGFDK